MKTSTMSVVVFALAQWVAATCALATSSGDTAKPTEKRVVADTSERFAQTRTAILHDLEQGGRYEFVKPDDRRDVETALSTIADILGKTGAVGTMPEDDRIRLFNVQERINALLTRNDSNRLICEKQAPLGTIIPVTTCRTFGEMERQKNHSATYLQDSSVKYQQAHPCTPRCGN